MPERLIHAVDQWWDSITHALLLTFVSLLFGLGGILRSKEKQSWRIIVGRCLTSAGLGMSAGAVLVFFPTVPLVAQMGVAAALASLGTSALERVIQRSFPRSGDRS